MTILSDLKYKCNVHSLDLSNWKVSLFFFREEEKLKLMQAAENAAMSGYS